jgi:Zn-dependent peptidase ImmA (M78 family)
MTSWRDAVLQGTKEAVRLQRELGLESKIEQTPGCIDVFAAIVQLNIPLMFKPLQGLLGAYLPKPNPGILVSTERNLSIQRFTGAHELGHAYMKHDGSLDDQAMLDRAPFGSHSYDSNEAAADAFAASFMIPRWLLEIHAGRHNWTAHSLLDPLTAYQMSLRVGASYDATCRSIKHHGIIDSRGMEKLLDIQPKKIKQHILDGKNLENWYPDVWVLTESDGGTRIQGGPNDIFVLKLRENSGAGYLWNLEDLEAAGFAIVTDTRQIPNEVQQVGGLVDRVLTARLNEQDRGHSGRISLNQTRPWETSDQSASSLTLIYDLFGKEEGLPRVRRNRLAAA